MGGKDREVAVEVKKVWEPPSDEKVLQKRVQAVARKRAGALTFHLLFHACERQGLGEPQRIKEAGRVHLASYGAVKCPVTHPRDKAEVQVICQALDWLKKGKVERCADILATRMMALEISAIDKGDTKRSVQWECRNQGTTTLAGQF